MFNEAQFPFSGDNKEKNKKQETPENKNISIEAIESIKKNPEMLRRMGVGIIHESLELKSETYIDRYAAYEKNKEGQWRKVCDMPIDKYCRTLETPFKGRGRNIEGLKQKFAGDQEVINETKHNKGKCVDKKDEDPGGNMFEQVTTRIFQQSLDENKFVVIRSEEQDDIKKKVDNIILEVGTGNVLFACDATIQTGAGLGKKYEEIQEINSDGGASLEGGIVFEENKENLPEIEEIDEKTGGYKKIKKDNIKIGRIENVPLFVINAYENEVKEIIESLALRELGFKKEKLSKEDLLRERKKLTTKEKRILEENIKSLKKQAENFRMIVGKNIENIEKNKTLTSEQQQKRLNYLKYLKNLDYAQKLLKEVSY